MALNRDEIKAKKARIRETIWRLLEERNIALFPRPVIGRIPNFKGSDIAAEKLTSLREWQNARVIKSNPDSPQYHVRLRALREGKYVLMATPRLRNGFILLDPSKIPSNRHSEAATINGAFRYGKPVKLVEIPRIDLVVTGCVAVDRRGVRLGKGGGFSELEYGILRELNLINENTPIVTTIHDLQVVNEEIPVEIHDLTIDYYTTPTRTVKVDSAIKHKPKGIYWELLTSELRELGVIKELFNIKKQL